MASILKSQLTTVLTTVEQIIPENPDIEIHKYYRIIDMYTDITKKEIELQKGEIAKYDIDILEDYRTRSKEDVERMIHLKQELYNVVKSVKYKLEAIERVRKMHGLDECDKNDSKAITNGDRDE